MLALLIALGVDNFGSGLFLPLTLVYATREVGLPLAVAGVTVTVGTGVGLPGPPVAGGGVDRVGPRPVVVACPLCGADDYHVRLDDREVIQHVRITGHDGDPAQLDGDCRGCLPLEVGLGERPLSVIVP